MTAHTVAEIVDIRGPHTELDNVVRRNKGFVPSDSAARSFGEIDQTTVRIVRQRPGARRSRSP